MGVIRVPPLPKKDLITFAKSPFGHRVVGFEFTDSVEVQGNHDVPTVSVEIEGRGQPRGPMPVVVQDAWASGGKCVVFGVRQLHDFCRHFAEPGAARFGVFAVQDVAKVFSELWSQKPVGSGGQLAHRSKDQAVVWCASQCIDPWWFM